MNTIAQDLPHSFRTLIRKPGFTIPVVLALALGLGANTAVFSVANTILLRSLPFPDADRLMLVWERNVKNPKMTEWPVSQPNFSDWRAACGALMEMAALGSPGAMVLTGLGRPPAPECQKCLGKHFHGSGTNALSGPDFYRG